MKNTDLFFPQSMNILKDSGLILKVKRQLPLIWKVWKALGFI